ncbi:hypothetical protein KPZU09_44440 [Klebsiella pneumoniae]|uniref:Uncharacterized protein n=1 Tax=Klebsiella pneumoniae TaxID=573 RepID=A0A919HU64_KLEPN|nr:hypothetical protein KPZU09_44440 [Klebsiella pneumoniae]
MIDEFINGFFPLAVGEKGAEPGVADLNAANIQHRLEDRRVARIFAADFAAGKTGQRHSLTICWKVFSLPSSGISSLVQPIGAIASLTLSLFIVGLLPLRLTGAAIHVQ